MRTSLNKYALAVIVSMLWVAAFLPSCGKKDSANSIRMLGQDTIDYPAADVTLRVFSEGKWGVYATAESGGEGWYSLNRQTGSQNGSVVLSIPAANDGDMRSVLITVEFDDGKQTVRLVQREFQDPATQIPRDWFEMPDGWENVGTNARVISHYLPGRKNVRSFTIKYNTRYYYPEWVAYPMHITYHSGSGRSNAWAWDPKIPQANQADMRGYISGYQRGHMMPSASRNVNNDANKQTFYGTNISPQAGNLNGGVWANLEIKVRTWTGYGSDSLYVVTGAALTKAGLGSISTTYSSGYRSKPIAVPNYFYKALVKRKNGEYGGIAFWFPHNNSSSYKRDLVQSDAITIKQLEEWIGEEFFPQLPASVSDRVKSERNFTMFPL